MEQTEEPSKTDEGQSRLTVGLERCPFADCESKPVVVDFEIGNHPYKRVYEVHCCFCGTTTRSFDTREHAETFWNWRSNA